MTERQPLPYDWKDVRERLQKHIHQLLLALTIKEKAKGGLVTPLNPTRKDRRPGSFVIWTGGAAPGAWKDYATGDQGDIIDLIQYLLRLRARIDAYWWALAFLNLERGVVRGADQAQQDRERAGRDAKAAQAKAEAAAREKSDALFRDWLTLAPIAGTLAETYLREARRIPLDRLKYAPGALRFAPRLEHFDPETGEITVWPAMVAAMTRGNKVTGVHRTWLARDGSGKAPVAKAKKMAGSVRGAAIRLSGGPSGLSPGKAAVAGVSGPLAIGEGIETCLTVAAARPDYRVWAAGSLSLMGLIRWPDCASAMVLLRDNDWKPEAQRAFAGVEAYWRAQAAGRPVVVAASAAGNDFNDWARGAA